MPDAPRPLWPGKPDWLCRLGAHDWREHSTACIRCGAAETQTRPWLVLVLLLGALVLAGVLYGVLRYADRDVLAAAPTSWAVGAVAPRGPRAPEGQSIAQLVVPSTQ